jgi:hypothetical protein
MEVNHTNRLDGAFPAESARGRGARGDGSAADDEGQREGQVRVA